ncbi:MAG: Transposase [Pseudoclavibacter caeni]|jgi:transposase
MIIVLTPVRERTGPSQLLDMVKDRSEQVFKQWHATHPQH